MMPIDAVPVDDPSLIQEGSRLPVFALELSIQRLVREAAVNRDFTPIHHDPVIAQQGGARTAYANTMLLQAMVEAMLRNWAGPVARIKSLEFAMRKFCYAGSVATAYGRVAEVVRGLDEVSAVIDVGVEAAGTTCVEGQAVVVFRDNLSAGDAHVAAHNG
jgi:acyl dehydratase